MIVYKMGVLWGFRRAIRFCVTCVLMVALDFLGLMAGSSPVNEGFFSRFRSNDRVGLGMSYVF